MMIDREHRGLSIRRQCGLLGIHRSGLYYHPCGESEENLLLLRLLDAQYFRTPFYGVRRLTAWLRSQGVEGARSLVGGIDRWSAEIDTSVPRY